MATDDCLKCGHFNGLGKHCKDQSTMRAVCLDGCSFFDNKETPIMNQCEIDGCKKMIDGKCAANNYNPKTWKLVGKGDKHTLCYAFTPKPKETPMIQEKDCRRCEKYDEEGKCPGVGGVGRFTPTITLGCNDQVPVQGRDCRNCKRFNGQGERCGVNSITANDLKLCCENFYPLQTSKPSPTVLTYTDEDDDETRIIKGDKVLSLENIWASRPCTGEYRAMSVIFTNEGFNPNTEIPFTQRNLDFLSDAAFQWLLDGDFFLKAKEERKEETFKIGDWFIDRSRENGLFLLAETAEGRIGVIGVDGSRLGKMWDKRSPVAVDDINKITRKDLNKLTGAPDWYIATTPPEIRRI